MTRFDLLSNEDRQIIRQSFPRLEWHRYYWKRDTGIWLFAEYKTLTIVDKFKEKRTQAPKCLI